MGFNVPTMIRVEMQLIVVMCCYMISAMMFFSESISIVIISHSCGICKLYPIDVEVKIKQVLKKYIIYYLFTDYLKVTVVQIYCGTFQTQGNMA